MATTPRNLVVLVTHGTDHELSSVAFTIANGGITAGLKVSIFLTSSGVDLVRKRALEITHVPPLDPLAALVKDFLARGGTLWACTPCVKARGYTQDDLIEGTVITGSSSMHATSRPSRAAAAGMLPLPPKQSSTSSPGRDHARSNGSSTPNGLWLG